VSFDVCGLDGGEVCLDLTFPSATLRAAAARLADVLVREGPFELVLGPAGYGLPLMRAEDVGARERSLMLLLREDEKRAEVGIEGMGAVIRALLRAGLPLVFGPGVVHLPTVPAYRKWNRIDMGTADKVASAALCIVDQARRLDVSYAESSFVMLELGGAFTAALAVDRGRIVDGLGGSSGPMGAQASGALDGEVAYLLGEHLSKATLFGGGPLSAHPGVDLSAAAALPALRRDPRLRDGWLAIEESAAKAVLALTAVVRRPREVLVSGRLVHAPGLLEALAERLAHVAPVRRVAGLGARASTAAQGAALLADGLAGGAFAPLAAQMRIRDARGSALDYLRLPGAEHIRLA
jgi:predicted butyrate kinase (DUF1464 family)